MTVIGDSAIVDDQDGSGAVQYAGSWGKAGVAQEFNSTTSFPQDTGDSLTFSFVGTSVQTYVTYTGSPTVFMSIDNGSFTSTFQRPQSESGSDVDPSDPIHNQPLWTDPPTNLADGPHTLFINLTSNTTAGTIFMDYFIYTISAHTPLQNATLFLDDRDSRINYGDGWRQFGTDPDFMHTSLGSTTTGNNFTYIFEGVGISWYGGINNDSADQMVQVNIVVDDRAPVVFAPGPQPQAITYNNQYFNVDGLEQGTHNMTVTALNDHTTWVDYFLVKPGNVSLLGTATSTSGSSGPSASPSATSPVTKHSSSTGAIVGGIVGGIIGLALILGILFWIRRRKQRSQFFVPAQLPSVTYEPVTSEINPPRSTIAIPSVVPPRKNAPVILAPPSSQQNSRQTPTASGSSNATESTVPSSSSKSRRTVPSNDSRNPDERTVPGNSRDPGDSEPYMDSGIRFTDSRPPPSYTAE